MLKTKSLTLAFGAFALAMTGMTATAGSWPNLPVKKPAAATADKPAMARIAKSDAVLAQGATAAGDFEYVGGESAWQLRQHRLALRGGGFVHAPECTLVADAGTAAAPAAGRKAKADEPAGFALPGA